MSNPGAEAGGEAASAAAAEAAAARAPLDAGFAPMALETPETSSDARRAVAPAADASWRAGFHRGYAPGEYARGGADLLRALASASAYVPAPATGSDPANLDARFARGAPSSAEAEAYASGARETARVTRSSATPERWTDLSGDRVDVVVTTNQYVESSGTHSIQAWASALLAASRSQAKPRPEKRTRRRDSARVRTTAPAVADASLAHETRRTETRKRTNTRSAHARVCMTRDMARRALRTPKVLAALARRAVADADSAGAFVFDAAKDGAKDSKDEPSSLETYDVNDTTTDRTCHVTDLGQNTDTDEWYVGWKRCLLPPPIRSATDAFRVSVEVGYQGDALRVAPELLERDPSAWTAAPFEPVGSRGKHVCSFVIAPSGRDTHAALETVVEIRAQYEQMRLGTMEAGASRTTAARDERHDAFPPSTPFFSTRATTSAQLASEEVFAYDPETNGSFDEALARLVSVANATTHTGPFLAYLAGPPSAADVLSSEDDKTRGSLATYAAARVAELADEDAARVDFDFVALPRDRLGRRRCTPAFARERATSAFRVAARRERKSTRAGAGTFGVSPNDARSVFAFAATAEPLVTVSRRSTSVTSVASNGSCFTNRDTCDHDVMSATLCAYALVTTGDDRALVVALTDDAGETFAVETTYASLVSSLVSSTDATPSSRVASAHANLADWLVRRTRAFTAARAAAAGDAYASPKASGGSARAAKRARVFFGAAERDVAADEARSAFSSVGAGVVVVEVLSANRESGESGDRAFASALRSAFGRLNDEVDAKDETGETKPTRTRVLLGETRLGFLSFRAEDEDERFSARSLDRSTIASLRADGSVATHAMCSCTRARADGFVAAVATRVADVVTKKKKKTTEIDSSDSSRVAFAFAALARAARAARGVDRGERARVSDVAPPHVAACASLAATLRDLERIAAGRGE